VHTTDAFCISLSVREKYWQPYLLPCASVWLLGPCFKTGGGTPFPSPTWSITEKKPCSRLAPCITLCNSYCAALSSSSHTPTNTHTRTHDVYVYVCVVCVCAKKCCASTVCVFLFFVGWASGLGIGFWLRGVQPRTTVRWLRGTCRSTNPRN